MANTTGPKYVHKYQDGSVVPASSLDHALVFKDTKVELSYHSFLDGRQITSANRVEFHNQVMGNIQNKVYPTTDHLFLRLVVGKYTFLYVSLDNSVRANQNGFSLKNRLPELCRTIIKFIKEAGGEGIVFFSESCRPSFDGGMNDRSGELKWTSIVRFIADTCNLFYLTEHANNKSSNGMAFGISVFCTPGYYQHMDRALPRHILTEGIGSATVGIKMDDGTLVWGIHFPLDFKNKGNDNHCAIAMKGLCALMDEHPGSVAFGDFNTIHGEMNDVIRANVADDKQMLGDDITFLGAYYDTVKTDEDWMPL